MKPWHGQPHGIDREENVHDLGTQNSRDAGLSGKVRRHQRHRRKHQHHRIDELKNRCRDGDNGVEAEI